MTPFIVGGIGYCQRQKIIFILFVVDTSLTAGDYVAECWTISAIYRNRRADRIQLTTEKPVELNGVHIKFNDFSVVAQTSVAYFHEIYKYRVFPYLWSKDF